MSTATERIMRERGDLTCFHEPFMYYHYVHRDVREFPHFDVDPNQPTSFDDVLALLTGAAETGPVFFKDMAYYVVPELFERPEFAGRFEHVFLVRDPRKSLMSYHKLDPDFSCEETGLEAQWRLADWLQSQAGIEPVVLRAESIQRDPRSAMSALWLRLGLAFVERAFEWDGERMPEDWKNVSQWHQGVTGSSGIRPTLGESDKEIDEQFARVCEAAPKLRTYLEHHLPFYEKLCALADTVSASR